MPVGQLDAEHTPLMQLLSAVHAVPHAPQCRGSRLRSKQPMGAVLQYVNPTRHQQAPEPLQYESSPQWTPQDLQLNGSAPRSTHREPPMVHRFAPLMQLHLPALHVEEDGHLVAQSPQCETSLARSEQLAPHITFGDVQLGASGPAKVSGGAPVSPIIGCVSRSIASVSIDASDTEESVAESTVTSVIEPSSAAATKLTSGYAQPRAAASAATASNQRLPNIRGSIAGLRSRHRTPHRESDACASASWCRIMSSVAKAAHCRRRAPFTIGTNTR